MARGPGLRLKGRARDRVLSEYMEMFAGQDPAVARLPGTRGVAAAIILMCLVPAALIMLSKLIDLPEWFICTGFALMMLAVLLTVVLLTTGVIGPRRRMWWAAMRKCGHDVCVVCGYLLEHRAGGSRLCPECGTPDDAQPVPLGQRPLNSEWPRFEAEAPAAPGPRKSDDPS